MATIRPDERRRFARCYGLARHVRIPGRRTHPLRGSRFQEPAGVPLVRRDGDGRGPHHARAPALQHRLLAHLPRDRRGPLRRAHAAAAVGRRQRLGRQRPRARARRLRVHGEAGHPLLRLPRPRRGPRGGVAARDQLQPGRGGGGAQVGTGAHRHPPALGHRQPVQPSALRARRRHELQRGRLRVRGLAGQEVHGGHPRARRPELRLLGRTRGLPEPAEHRHEARAGPPGPVPAPGGRARRPHRLRRHPAGRAQAQGADQAPVRYRRRRLHQLPARLRPDRALQAQHRDQPRDPGRPRDGA